MKPVVPTGPSATSAAPALHSRSLAIAAALLLSLSLAACGGGATDPAQSRDSDSPTSETSTTSSSDSSLSKGAALSSAELADAEKAAVSADASGSAPLLDELQPGQIAPKSAYASGDVVRKAGAVRIPVYRFYNSSTGAHFFTSSTAERDNVISKLSPPFSYEGPAFSVASAFSPGLSPVHRFYNTQTGVHFYTISETERASVAANMPQFLYEGIAYHASQVSGQGLIPFYRFYVPAKGFHFYTANEAEKASVIANLSATYSYEGIGYYVLDSNWTAEKLPHSGITASQCHMAGSDTLVSCSAMGPIALNPQQDGHRRTINPLSYSAIGVNPLISCVKDNVTGLVWEGKPDDGGLRDKDNTYTNLGNGQSGDASAYVTAVNAMKLCGYSDWRLPTVSELQGIVDYSTYNPSINTTWFPNTKNTYYWTSDVVSDSNANAWTVPFTEGHFIPSTRSTPQAVRLVRGQSPTGPRYAFTSVAYGADAANNLVNDAWTGLQWRRCEVGRTWNGTTCTGTASTFTHEQALAQAKSQSGWRLPNLKELSSLVDRSLDTLTIDATAFPDATPGMLWSSTPHVGNNTMAWNINFFTGYATVDLRNRSNAIRLIRVPQ